jgi:hypothetical protein
LKIKTCPNFLENVCKFCKRFDEHLLKFCDWSGAKEYQPDGSRQELCNAYLVAKIGFDTAVDEPLKVWITDLSDLACRSHAKRLANRTKRVQSVQFADRGKCLPPSIRRF